MPNKKFYITTAIDYVNALPHIGHALEKVQADVLARYHRIQGEKVFFLTGTDENSLKNVRAAEKEKISIKELVEKYAKKFYELRRALNLSFDDFIRTTEERHIKGAQKLWQVCENDIYKKKYKGLYCIGCEAFYKESELIDGLCPEHRVEPELVEEENYFFRLSKYEDKLKEIIKRDEIKIIPEARKNETLSFIKSGLEDICISRSSERAKGWGIDVPGDPSQKIWVWFEALSNYITAIGYGQDDKKLKEYWPADIHLIGKGVSRFHTIYWPAILLSAGISLPKTIFIHGYITSGGQKMSKSLGNVVDPFGLVNRYGTDPVRYFLLREVSPTEDGDFTDEKFRERYNADLAKGLGNLIARVITLLAKNSKSQILIPKQIQNPELKRIINKTQEKYKEALEEFRFNEALVSIWELISFCDKYIEEKKPWENKNQKVISDLLFALENIAQLLKPFLPETSEKIIKQLKSKESKPLFPKLNS
jgi:methionyl-tRNA synthetase